MDKKLYKSQNDKVISGVCGGIAEYFSVDAVIVRLIWLFTIIFGGVGVTAYIICSIFIPKRKNGIDLVKHKKPHFENNNGGSYFGFGLVLLGGYFLLSRVFHFTWFRMGNLWPIFLVIGGFYLIFRDKD
ncbi:PspC domain-containing protein [Helicovermis profundi]|uniref:PspC domain-containing protein n=1 Tax=Helicovermis profundi TaxID=3065157 RepID=A0AAU9E964_9FIRM|nr:PspC domain-containing protein [Clostridia bacterium S502]